MRASLVVVLLAIAAAGCALDAPTSCDFPGLAHCVDYLSAEARERAPSTCATLRGVFSPTACRTADRVACCTYAPSPGAPPTERTSYYPPFHAGQVAAMCRTGIGSSTRRFEPP